MKIVAIIPARYASTRFPGKPLIDIAGKSMIQRVVERVSACSGLTAVLVATDDERIREHVESLGYRAIMTGAHHVSGTDRCREALHLSGIDADAVINIQGDEPFVEPAQIEQLMALIAHPDAAIATLVKPITSAAQLTETSKVKVVLSNDGAALYFSRQAIPFRRDIPISEWLSGQTYYKHLGLYAFRSTVLEEVCSISPSALELAESLEQLRWLENGYSIRVGISEFETPAIDTPEDLQAVISAYFS
jgi:3-deoxy-manno-octulosonate cytidylyltransferase (CMP-KDO synthetase)